MRSSTKFKNVFPPAVHMGGHPKYWAQYLGYPPKWTARGKLILNSTEHLTKYLLTFLTPNYLSNLQSHEFINFSGYRSSENGKILLMVRNSPNCAPRGKIFLTLTVDTFLYLHSKFQQNNFQFDKTKVI